MREPKGRPDRQLLQLFLCFGLLLSFGGGIACRQGEEFRSAASVESQSSPLKTPVRVVTYNYEVINTYPHDSRAFTQGLLDQDGFLYESTGLNGQSSLRKVDLLTGEVKQRIDVPQTYFAEGLALFNRRLYQLTWQSRLGFIYDVENFQVQRTFNYRGEGWGLTHDGQQLIMSDGTNRLRFLDPETLDVKREIDVIDGDRPINLLNELEFVKGDLWSNIWQSDRLVRINPESGQVTGWVNLAGLLSSEDRLRGTDVLNGIAYDEVGNRLFVTGKLWPKLFEIRLIERGSAPTR
ncbi:MAG: glutaminyl-peptide cyclotransferase [Acidobacteriota bacterium]